MKNLKLVLGMCSLMHCLSSSATNYYFSSSSGNDTRTTLQARSSSSPWQSIQKLNSIMSQLLPGDSVLFKRGDTFYGAIVITKSGTAAQPIVFGAYGTGANPVITGFTQVSSWVNTGKNIWESSSAVSTLTSCNMVAVAGQNIPVGRTPNKGYFTINSHNRKNSLTSASLTGINWTGAEAVIKTTHFTINKAVIKSQTASEIFYDSTYLFYTPKDDWGFFIQKDLRTLDTQNEWYYNPVSKKISIYSTNTPGVVSVATVDNLFTLNAADITVSNLSFTGANMNSIHRNTSMANIGGFHLKNCSINFSGLSGIELKVHSSTIESTVINNSNDHAISTQTCKDITIKNNLIRNSGLTPGMGRNGMAFSAIWVGAIAGSKTIVTGNTIINTGHNGITFGIDDALISNNRIDSFNLVIDDGGGIYGGKNGILKNNIISNGIGSWDGTTSTSGLVAGIYIDDNGANNKISDNSIFNSNWAGIFIHNTKSCDIRHNTVFNAKTAQILFQADNEVGRVRLNNVKNNYFVAKEVSQTTATFKSQINDLDSIGTLDSNYYARPMDDMLTINTSYKDGGASINDQFTIANWNQRYGKDKASKPSAVKILPYTVNRLIGTNSVLNGLFTDNTLNLSTYSVVNTSKVYFDKTKLDNGSARIESPDDCMAGVKINKVENTKRYVLKFSSLANKEFNLEVYLRQGPSPSKVLSDVKMIRIPADRKEHEILINYPITEANPVIILNVKNKGVTFWLDNIHFMEADISPTSANDVFRFEYNASDAVKEIALDGTYLGIDSTVYTDKLVLAPYSSKIIIKSKGALPVTTLPVKLISLSADISKDKVPVYWTTAEELNSSHYIVERSADGRVFGEIGKVTSNNSSSLNKYNFTDEKPLNGMSYYRLVMVDKDGTREFSNIISVRKTGKGIIIDKITCSGSNLEFQVNSSSQQMIQYNVVDVSGRVVLKKNLLLEKGDNIVASPIAGLSKNIYYLNVITNQGNFARAFLKN